MWEERVANARIDIEMTRLLCLKAADMMDRAGNKAAQGEIAMIKVAAPIMALKIIDDAIQAFGAAGSRRTRDSLARLRVDPDVAPGRRAGRSAPPRDRPARVQKASMTEQLVDEEALGRWLSANVEGFQVPFDLTKFPSGQSNPTYRIRAASGDYVMRRKPFGKLLPSAHAVDREYRLLFGLHPLGFPVPQPLALCDDPEVIGAIFCVMELARGRPTPTVRCPSSTRLLAAACTSR